MKLVLHLICNPYDTLERDGMQVLLCKLLNLSKLSRNTGSHQIVMETDNVSYSLAIQSVWEDTPTLQLNQWDRLFKT